MKNIFAPFFLITISLACGTTQKVVEPPEPRVPARFDYSPPSREKAASTGISISIVRPIYVGQNPEYYIPPFKEMATSMGNDFEELLTAKGFTVRGPFGSRDEMVYNDKINSSFILEIGIDINPMYNRKHTTVTKTNWGSIVNKSTPPTTTTYNVFGEITLAGNLVINAKSAQYGELIWKKNIALVPQSFSYNGSLSWNAPPSMADELSQDNKVYNTLSNELQKFYLQALGLAWQQIDALEMKTVSEQSKKADKKGG